MLVPVLSLAEIWEFVNTKWKERGRNTFCSPRNETSTGLYGCKFLFAMTDNRMYLLWGNRFIQERVEKAPRQVRHTGTE
jgi:hypothetical protein